jgi:predicted anti-sigma-YlaC factor YlaD
MQKAASLVTPENSMIVDLDCSAVRQALVDDMEGDLTPEMKARLERHLNSCSQCNAVYDGVRNVV